MATEVRRIIYGPIGMTLNQSSAKGDRIHESAWVPRTAGSAKACMYTRLMSTEGSHMTRMYEPETMRAWIPFNR